MDEDCAKKTFEDLGLNEWLVKQCQAVGMLRPTPIQNNCVPRILQGEYSREFQNRSSTIACSLTLSLPLALVNIIVNRSTWTKSMVKPLLHFYGETLGPRVGIGRMNLDIVQGRI